LERRGDDATLISALVNKSHARRLISPTQRLDQLGLHVAVIPLKPQHRPPAHPRRRRRVLERPFQRRPRHPRLVGPKDGTFQINPLDALVVGP
jgi:hypothetical protein